MASPGPVMNLPAGSQSAITQQRLQLENALKGSASWFVIVAALSIINSVLSMAGASIRFIFGMGVTQVVDAMARQAGSAGVMLNLIINGMIAGVFVLFWHFARKGQKWSWIVGMGIYLIDGLILLPFQDYLGAAFHAYALYRMFLGFRLLSAYESLKHQESTGAISSTIG